MNCRCDHPQTTHSDGGRGTCTAPGCKCNLFQERPRKAGPPLEGDPGNPDRPPPKSPPAAEQADAGPSERLVPRPTTPEPQRPAQARTARPATGVPQAVAAGVEMAQAREAAAAQGKPLYHLIPWGFIRGLVRVFQAPLDSGKYQANDWQKLDPETVRRDKFNALLAHVDHAMDQPGVMDEESGESHWLHVAANAMILWWYERRSSASQDR